MRRAPRAGAWRPPGPGWRRGHLPSRHRGNRRRVAALAAIVFSVGLCCIPICLHLWVERRVRDRVFADAASAPNRPFAIVFGAGLWSDGSLTPVLADRVATAVDLLRAGAVDRLLFSGDNRRVDYNEPQAMLEYAIGLGAPHDAIVLDYAGRRTWDTCYRAREIFGITRAIVVTQRFHIARVLYLCDALGIDAVGVVADRQTYSRRRIIWETREYVALMQAGWDVNVRRPLPVLGERMPIESSAE